MIIMVVVIRVSVSISVVVIFLFFITKYGMTKSSDSVVDKSKEEVSVVVIYFKSIFYKLVHNFVCHIINFFIAEYGMTKSSNSMNCVMSNSGYSSDSVMNKSKDEIVSSFAIFSLENILDHLFSQYFSKFFLFFISKYGMTKSSNSTDCVMSNSSYSSDSVVNKSKDEISVFFVVFHICLFKKFICQFFSQFVAFFISEYGMTESSNSMNCVMSNSG